MITGKANIKSYLKQENFEYCERLVFCQRQRPKVGKDPYSLPEIEGDSL